MAEIEGENQVQSEPQGETKNQNKDYEILREDYPNYDLSFKVIVIGNSGNYFYIIYK